MCSAINGNISNPNYAAFFRTNFQWAVMENESKWYANEPSRSNVTYAVANSITNFCHTNGITMRGHTIFWAVEQFVQPWVTNLSNADLRRADLAGTDLTDARLTEADLGGANLTGANLAGASLFRIRGNHACFDGADLSGASLDRAGLRNARLHKTCLVQTSLRAADLRGADLREAEFWGADLRGADLRMADLREADLTGANLRGADLRGAKIDGIIAEPSQVRSARGGQNIPVEADDAIRLPTPIIELRPQPEPMTGSTASSEARRRVAAGAMAMGIAAMAVAGVSLLELPSDDVEPAVLNTVQERASLEITGDGAIEIELISADGTELERARLPLDRDLLSDRTDVVAVRARSLDGSDLECNIGKGTRVHHAGPAVDVTCVTP